MDTFYASKSRHRIAQIIGPHGSGKTTLLETLAKAFEIRGVAVVWSTLNDQRRRLSASFAPGIGTPETVYFLDGYEQLSTVDRLRVRWQDWNHTVGLIWTTHKPAMLIPVLYQTIPRFERFRQIVEHLTAETRFSFDKAALYEVFQRHDGNFRNAFFELYDRVAFD